MIWDVRDCVLEEVLGLGPASRRAISASKRS